MIGGNTQAFMVLLSDVLVTTKNVDENGLLEIRQVHPVSSFDVVSLPDTADLKNAFKIQIQQNNVTISLESAMEKRQWLNKFKQVAH